ncbi:aminopeptidase N [Gemmobacter sp.]|uniref:aminopeptidase N n=1 Tax=Gemmobacter sp. TaxID=1898957 RepID=UPI002AFF892D|nr:aminopeptidase N [Gemmobacter sp.]
MQDAAPQTIHLADYRPYPFRVETVDLAFQLAPAATRVRSRIVFAPLVPGTDLRLEGEGLRLIAASIDGAALALEPDATGLTVPAALLPDRPFLWEAEVEIAPQGNTALEGLYMSGGMYCTQCEAEGFRKITFYPDRPDMMAPFRVRIEGDMPVLLSNGNLVAEGPGWAEWHDPWPKPAYLFALVAGDLRAHPGRFTTRSGRDVALNIWVRPGDEARCDWALQSLIRSMDWDERVYGREYDLDIFNIVAVDDFNMGAMENKGLNIFNSKLVLASPATATDTDYERIEAVIAHEYFHNWTGNRITCRDWFQLCLKEGLTVYRDQQFSGDLRSHAVKRIEDVLTLRARQFREDAGPLAHPVRPESFVEINNFYTATVYEKGAELIGMLRRLVGDDGYARALDLYFDRHDGQACTIEDWLTVFQDATGRDLRQFARWYSQAGTPRVAVREDWRDGRYALTLSQHLPAAPGQPDPQPLHIPVAVGLLNPNGDQVVPTTVLELTGAEQTFTFDGLASRPVPSVLRGFSAPVILDHPQDDATRAFLLAHDTDPFNRWEAGRALAKQVLARMVADGAATAPDWLDAMARLIRDETLDPAFRALALRLPGEDDMAQTLHETGIVPDPDRIHRTRRQMAEALARHLAADLPSLWDSLRQPGPFSPEAPAAGRRALRNAVLALMNRIDNGAHAAQAWAQADNMTDRIAALGCLIEAGQGGPEIAAFAQDWAQDRLVMDKWFTLQIAHAAPAQAVETAARLTARADFDWKNPNRFRAAIGALTANHAGFHQADGSGYRLVADWLIRLDPVNPQTAARMSTAFETLARYDADRQGLIRAELSRIRATPGLSRDLSEMTARMLG